MESLNKPAEDRLNDLLQEWEESVLSGRPLSSTELCRDCPELMADLERALSQLQTLDQLMFPERYVESSNSPPSSVSQPTSLRLPSIPGYELIEEIGRGGMGVVYKARQNSLNRLVAIKTLFGGTSWNSSFLSRLQREAKGMSLIKHPHVVQVIDFVRTPVEVAIVMEYVEGENLDTRLKRSLMTPKETTETVILLARTVHHVHQHGLLHRDIKPANILIDLSGTIKLADFGIVKEMDNRDGLTGTGDIFGTPSYMAIEQIPECGLPVDVRTDVYAIGATLYEMLSGRPPFVGVSRSDTLRQVQDREPVPLRTLNPQTPRDLETICLKCLEKDPDQRFASALELAEDLERLRDGLPIRSRPIGLLERVRRSCRRHPAQTAFVLLASAASTAIMMLLLINYNNITSYNRTITLKNVEQARLIRELELTAAKATSLQVIAEREGETSRQQKQLAIRSEQRAREALYISTMKRAADVMRHGDSREFITLLESQIPLVGETDLRGFEWWHLYRRSKLVTRPLLMVGEPQHVLARVRGQNQLAVAGADAVVRIFEDETGEVYQSIPTGQIEVNDISYSRVNNDVATAGDDGTIVVWDSTTWNERIRFKAHPGKAFQVRFTWDGSQIVVSGDDPVIRVYKAHSGELEFEFKGHDNSVRSLPADLLKANFWSTSKDRTLRLWNLPSQTEVKSLAADSEIRVIIHSYHRDIVIYGNEKGEVVIEHIQTKPPFSRRRIGQVDLLDRIVSLALTSITERNRLPGGPSDGFILAIGDTSGQIRICSMNSKFELLDQESRAWRAHRGRVYSMAWSKGLRLTSAGSDGQVINWDLADPSADPKEFDIGFADRFSLRRNTSTIFVTSRTNDTATTKLTYWDWKRGLETDRIGETENLYQTISPDGSMLVSILPQGDPNKFDRTDEMHLFAFPKDRNKVMSNRPVAKFAPLKGVLSNLRFSPDSKRVAVSKWLQNDAGEVESEAVWIVDLPDEQKLPLDNLSDGTLNAVTMSDALLIPVPSARDCSFAPDGNHLALVTQKGLVLWNILESKIGWKRTNPAVHKVVFSPDGTLIATCDSNRMVEMINTQDGKTRFQSTNHRAAVRAISFSPDGSLLVTGDQLGTIKFWHVKSGQEVLEVRYPKNAILHFEFSEEGDQLICQLDPDDNDLPQRIVIIDGSKIQP